MYRMTRSERESHPASEDELERSRARVRCGSLPSRHLRHDRNSTSRAPTTPSTATAASSRISRNELLNRACQAASPRRQIAQGAISAFFHFAPPLRSRRGDRRDACTVPSGWLVEVAGCWATWNMTFLVLESWGSVNLWIKTHTRTSS